MAGSLTTRLAAEIEASASDEPASRTQQRQSAVTSPFELNYDLDRFRVDRGTMRDVGGLVALSKLL
jgi:hypothetical protein